MMGLRGDDGMAVMMGLRNFRMGRRMQPWLGKTKWL
jgi:hypothetical protein